MIMAWLLKGWGLLKQVPREVWYALAALAVIWFYGNQRFDAGYDKRDAEQAEIERKAAEKARQGDAAAGGAVETERGDIAASNERARDAAHDSDDPLRDGLNSLRD